MGIDNSSSLFNNSNMDAGELIVGTKYKSSVIKYFPTVVFVKQLTDNKYMFESIGTKTPVPLTPRFIEQLTPVK
jgi:hypothetical protein